LKSIYLAISVRPNLQTLANENQVRSFIFAFPLVTTDFRT